MRAAVIFPGQGSEYPGMLSCIRKFLLTEEIFGRINHAAGKDIAGIRSDKVQ